MDACTIDSKGLGCASDELGKAIQDTAVLAGRLDTENAFIQTAKAEGWDAVQMMQFIDKMRLYYD